MSNIVKLENIEDKIILIREVQVLLDSDLAELYGVSTKEVNQAVSNNPDKFPDDYIIALNKDEKNGLVKNFDRFNRLKHSTVMPKAFTEKGLYMLATILKSKSAVQTTLAIIDTFYKIRHLSRNMAALSKVSDEAEQKLLMQKSGEIIAEILDDDLETTETETTVELNFALLKFKHIIKKKKQD